MSFQLETAAHPERLRRVAIDPVSRVEGHGKVTIVLDDQNGEIRNETQDVKSGTNVTFSAGEYGFFAEVDAGKNFSYRYTYGDGLNDNGTTAASGVYFYRLSAGKLDTSRKMVLIR